MARSIADLVKNAAQRLPDIESPAFGAAFDSFGGSRVVLIGDASHGTSEFYRARAAITQRLIERHGFNIVAIESDYPDAKAIDRYVRHNPQRKTTTSPLRVFNHFPLWMWRNQETKSFVDWLRQHNSQLTKEQRAAFYGLDLYSMGTSIRSVIEYLEGVDKDLAKYARQKYGCLDPWVEDPAQYGRHAMNKGFAPCESGVLKVLKQLLQKRLDFARQDQDGESFFDAEMNARLVKGAESYYRAMYQGSDESWNQRDTHMFNTFVSLLKSRPASKAVVWAHNSHLGDARYTGMGENRNELNLGQLCRETFGKSVSIIGCGTHTGTVAAADEWDDPMRIMKVNPSRSDSYEMVMHETGIPSFLLDLREDRCPPEVREALMKRRLERFIGVIYRPHSERRSHYSQAVLPKQFDAFVWFDETNAVEAFETAQPKEPVSALETYPFGL